MQNESKNHTVSPFWFLVHGSGMLTAFHLQAWRVQPKELFWHELLVLTILLQVREKDCILIVKADSNGKSDPYVIVGLTTNIAKSKFKTQIVKKV